MATQAQTKAKEEAQVTTVKMTDGRAVDFTGKRKVIKEDLGEIEDMKFRMDFISGQTRIIVVPETLAPRFALHGAKQKYGDQLAGLTDVDDMVLAIDALDARIQKGEWNEEREGSGLAGTSVLLRALVEYGGQDVETVKAFLSPMSNAEKLALRNDPAIKPIVDKIEAEKQSKAPKVDTAGLLGKLKAGLVASGAPAANQPQAVA